MSKEELSALLKILDKVDCEFGRLSGLDCPEYVNPDSMLWDEVVKLKNEIADALNIETD